MTLIAVVDHGAGNLVSIAQGLGRAGAEVLVAESPLELAGADGVVLPGVGATDAAMRRLEAAGFPDRLRSLDVPLLGICVGLQLLFEASEEGGDGCLGMLEGKVRRLEEAPRLPHIGWNDVHRVRDDPLFAGIPQDTPFYFVHGFAPDPADEEVVVATTEYGGRFVSAIRSGRVAGLQFHPERSGRSGLRVLANFVETCRAA